jgi:phosphoribosylformylglycinamidine synthase subunit PurL
MEPWEIMISESQERMVAVVRPTMLAAAQAVCDRWELEHAAIGEVTDSRLLRALHNGTVVGEIPPGLLTDECPRYEVEQQAHKADGWPRGRPAPVDTSWMVEQYD